MIADSIGAQLVGGDAPKLRTACENCRQSKVKCNLSGKNVCTRCLRNGLQCQYGFANRSGKPKGSKNRATLRKLGQLPEEKSPVRGYRGSQLGPPSIDREPLVTTGYSTHLSEPIIDDDVGDYLLFSSDAFKLISLSPLGHKGLFDSRPIESLEQPARS